MTKTHYNRTNRIRNTIEAALIALGRPATWPEINEWCHENTKKWYRHAPTKSQIGSILNTDHRIQKVGVTLVEGYGHQRSQYTVWALREWL